MSSDVGYSLIPISFQNNTLTNCDASSKIHLTSLEDYAFNIRLLFFATDNFFRSPFIWFEMRLEFA